MKSGLLLILVLLIGSKIFAQNSILGLVTDAESTKPVPYVSIGIINKADGTVSTINGSYQINLDALISDADTLKFSSIGYKSKAFLVADVKKLLKNGALNVSLERSVQELKQVDVSNRPVKVKILGYHTESKLFGVGFGSNSMGAQGGVRIPIKHPNTNIESFSFYVIKNVFEQLTFRLNVYEMIDGKPGNSILNGNIIFKVGDKQTGVITVDLAAYNIVVDKDILVAVEWIESKPVTTTGTIAVAAVLFGSSYFKQASQYFWVKKSTGLGFSVKANY